MRSVEGAKSTAFKSDGRFLVSVVINDHSQSHHIAHEKKLVPAGVRDFTGSSQNFGEPDEFVRGQIYLGCEGMEVFHCGLKQLLGARIGGLIERPESGLSDIGGGGVGGNRVHHTGACSSTEHLCGR